jgi:hypothetical protein
MTLSTESYSPIKEQIIETNERVVETSHAQTKDVREVVKDILGYDIFERQLIAEGAWALREESRNFAESTLDAAHETWPDE